MPKRNKKAEFALAKTVAEGMTHTRWEQLGQDVHQAALRTAKILHLLGYTRSEVEKPKAPVKDNSL